MSSNQLYHLGPCYCSRCNDYIVHHLNVERPFMGSGPTTPFNIWMDLIKKSRVICGRCGSENKPTAEEQQLFESLKKAGLITLNQESDFKEKLKNLIIQSNIIEEYSDRKKEEIISDISQDYLNSNIPYSWFENYFLIALAIVLKDKMFDDYLYR